MTPDSLVVTHYPCVDGDTYDYTVFSEGVGVVLDDVMDIEFEASMVDAGFGKVTIPAAHDYATTPEPGDIFAIDIVGDDGIAVRAFAFIYRDSEWIALDDGEEVDQTVTFNGPGHLAIGQDGRIEPPGKMGRFPIVTDFVFDFTHPGYIEGVEWIAASEVISVEDAQVDGAWGFLQTWGESMPPHAVSGVGSGTTMILWAADGTPDGLGTAVGDCYFRDTFTTAFDGMHILYFSGDNIIEVWIDGKSMGSAGTGGNPLTSGFQHANEVSVSLSPGEHLIAIKGQNFPPFGAPNPGGVAAAVYVPGYPPTLVFETTSAMHIWEYAPEQPGMSIGTVERLMLEAQLDVGRFGFIDLDFDDTEDSAAADWDPLPCVAVKAGADDVYSTNLKIITLYADLIMDPNDWTLHGYNKATFAPVSGVEFEVGNLTSLRFLREDMTAGELAVLSGIGWSRDGSGSRREGFIELGAENNAGEVGRAADATLLVYANPREETRLTYVPRDDSERPWVNPLFVPGCTVTAPTRTGSTTTDRTVRVGCKWNKNAERVIVEVSVADLILQDQERILNALKG